MGGFIGYELDRTHGVPSDDPGLEGLIWGALATSAILSPTFVYLENGSQGHLVRALAATAAVTALFVGAFSDSESGSVLVLLPAAQAFAAVASIR